MVTVPAIDVSISVRAWGVDQEGYMCSQPSSSCNMHTTQRFLASEKTGMCSVSKSPGGGLGGAGFVVACVGGVS